MTPEKDKQLCEKYPELFRDRNDKGSREPIAWGIECDDGWYDLISVLCNCIQNEMNNFTTNKPQDEVEALAIKVTQIKEKFGGLRFYTTGGNDRVHGMITMAESMSYKICEVCGQPGNTRNTGWIKVMCDPCVKDRNKG